MDQSTIYKILFMSLLHPLMIPIFSSIMTREIVAFNPTIVVFTLASWLFIHHHDMKFHHRLIERFFFRS